MAELTFTTADNLIEAALFDSVNHTLRRRLPAAANVAALRAVKSRGASVAGGYQHADHEMIYVTSAGVCYEWSKMSTSADDGNLVIKPTDAGAGNGRWLKTNSTVQTGPLLDVRLYQGEQTEREILERLLGQIPAAVIRFESGDHEAKSNKRGALYKYVTQWDVWAASSNFRGAAEPEAVVGSAVDLADPGVNVLIGKLKQLFAGLSGEEMGQPGIAHCEIGAVKPLIRSLSERRFVYSLSVTVRATVHNTDDEDAPGSSVPLTEIDLSWAIPTS